MCDVTTSTYIDVGASVGGEVGAGVGAAVGDGVGLHAQTSSPKVRAYRAVMHRRPVPVQAGRADTTMGAKCTGQQAPVRSAPPVNAARDGAERADCAHDAMRRACGSHLGVGDAVGAGVGEGEGEGEGDGLRIHRVRTQSRPRSHVQRRTGAPCMPLHECECALGPSPVTLVRRIGRVPFRAALIYSMCCPRNKRCAAAFVTSFHTLAVHP